MQHNKFVLCACISPSQHFWDSEDSITLRCDPVTPLFLRKTSASAPRAEASPPAVVAATAVGAGSAGRAWRRWGPPAPAADVTPSDRVRSWRSGSETSGDVSSFWA